MTIDLLVEKLIAEIKAVKGAEGQPPNAPPVSAEDQGPAFVKTASAASKAEAAVLEQIALLEERHAEEIAAEELADARAGDEDDEDEKEEEIHDGESADLALESSGGMGGDESLDLALAEPDAMDASAAGAGEAPSGAQGFLGGSSGGGWSAPGWLAPAAALGAGAIGGGIAAAAGSSSEAEPSLPPVAPSSTVVSGTVMMGPVTRGLSVNIYDDQGNLLGTGAVNENSQYQVDVGDYSGMVIVRLSDDNETDGNYMDEALGVEQDLTVDLRAMTVVSGGEVVLNITPLTELAVRELGLETTDDINLSGIAATEEQVEAVNLAISRLFLGEGEPSVEIADIAPVIDRDGNDTSDTSNAYGKLLAALSGADASETIAGALGMEATIAALSEAITEAFSGSDVTWSDQEDDGVAARAIVQFGLDIAKNNPVLTIADDFLNDAGIRFDRDAPTVLETILSVGENAMAVGVLSAQDISGIEAWALVEGEGGDNNDLFTLSPDGTLTLNSPEDFEATSAPFSIRVSVVDKLGNTAEAVITVNVADVNEAPVSAPLEDQNGIIFQDFTLDASVAFSDVDDGDTLTFSAEGLPEGYAIDSVTGVISGQASSGGEATVTVTATDSGGLTVSESFTISVFTAPVLLAIEGEGGAFFKEGDEMRLAVQLSEAVTVTTPGDAPTLTLNFNGVEVVATYDAQDSADGSILYFTATGPAGEGDDLSITSTELFGATFIGALTGEDLITDFTDRTFDAVTIDNTAPTLEIGIDGEFVLKGETPLVTFTFSEPPRSFELSDISVSGGVLTDFLVDQNNPSVYTAIFVADEDAEGTATISVDQSDYEDRAGNSGEAVTPLSVDFDTLSPTVADIDLNLDPVGGAPLLTVTFDDAPVGFTIDDIEINGGVLSNLRLADSGDPTVYVADFTADAGFTGAFSASIASGAYADDSGNSGAGASTPMLSVNSPSSTGFIGKSQLDILTISGSATDGADISFFIAKKNTIPLVTTQTRTDTASNGLWNVTMDLTTFASTAGDGVYVIQALASVDGKTVSGVTREFTIDTAIEAPTVVSPPSLITEETFDPNGEMTLAFTAQDDVVRVEVEWQGSDLSRDAAFNADTGQWEVVFTSGELAALGDGEAGFVAYATDRANNRAPEDASSPIAVTLELDNQAPEVANVTIAPPIVSINAADGTEILDLTNLPEGAGAAFIDRDDPASSNADLRYSAALASGGPLPGWLQVTQEGVVEVVGGAPSEPESLIITVTATDGGGRFETRDITIEVAGPPVISGIGTMFSEQFGVTPGSPFNFIVSFDQEVTVSTADSMILKLDLNGQEFDAAYVGPLGGGENEFVFQATAPSTEGRGFSIVAINLNGAEITSPTTGLPLNTNQVGQSTDLITIDGTAPAISTAELSVDENETFVGTIQVTDNIDTELSWEFRSGVGGDNNELFSLSEDGQLTLLTPRDFEGAASSYSIRVRATDLAGNFSDQIITVTLNDVNEAPEASAQSIETQVVATEAADQTVILDLTDLNGDGAGGGDVAFTDPDDGATPNGQLQYSATLQGGGNLPGWLVVTPAGLVRVVGGAPSEPESLTITVTATDGEFSAQRDIDIEIVAAPTLTSLVDDTNNLDVRSDLVMTASEAVVLTGVAKTYDITIRDLGGLNDEGKGYREENNDNTQTISITINADGEIVGVETLIGDPLNPSHREDHGSDLSQLLTIDGDEITIKPFFDLDLSSRYQIDVDAGLFVGDASGQGSAAFDGTTASDFSTVNPENANDVASAEQAQWFQNGSLVDSHRWIRLDNNGDPIGSVDDLGAINDGAYMLVLKDWDLDGVNGVEKAGDLGLFEDGVQSTVFNVSVDGFGLDDLVYIDDQYNNGTVNAPGTRGPISQGGGATRIEWDGGTGQGQGFLLLNPDAGLDFSQVGLIDRPDFPGQNLSEVLNGIGNSPVISG